MRIHLSYFDQNESFRQALPEGGVSGRVVRQIALQDWGDNWYLLDLEQDFEYNGQRHNHALIRSRWEGYEVGGNDETSVFILLLRDPSVLDKPTLESADFEHAAWGMARPEPVV
jgi:hypothetical protein